MYLYSCINIYIFIYWLIYLFIYVFIYLLYACVCVHIICTHRHMYTSCITPIQRHFISRCTGDVACGTGWLLLWWPGRHFYEDSFGWKCSDIRLVSEAQSRWFRSLATTIRLAKTGGIKCPWIPQFGGSPTEKREDWLTTTKDFDFICCRNPPRLFEKLDKTLASPEFDHGSRLTYLSHLQLHF